MFVVILFGGVSINNYYRLADSHRHLVLINEIFIPLSREVAQLQEKLASLSEDMHRFYFYEGRTSEQSTFSRVVRDLYPYVINKKFDAAENLLDRPARGRVVEMTGQLRDRLKRSRQSFDQLIAVNDSSEFRKRYTELKLELRGFSRLLDEEAQKITVSAQNKGRNHLIVSLGLSAVVLLFGVFVLFFSLRTLEPLPQLIESLRKIGDGDFLKSLKIKTSAKDEVSLLAREYNRMLEALCQRDKKIESQQKELVRAERLAAVGQLSAEVVHEIRNPLNSINLNIDWLQMSLKDAEEETSKTLVSIAKEIQRLNQITESYLVRARLPVANSERANVHDVLAEVVEFSREEDRSRNISVSTEFTDAAIFVKTSHSRLKQVFLNLLKNAKEAMPQGGKIHVRTAQSENISTIHISDNGSGMNDAIRRKTFTPFYTTKENGTGLGLVLTKNIVDEAEGSIQCQSELGQGTTFTLQFPA